MLAIGAVGLVYMLFIVNTGITGMIEAQKLEQVFFGPIN